MDPPEQKLLMVQKRASASLGMYLVVGVLGDRPTCGIDHLIEIKVASV
jgi:hypothetical protein